MKIRSGIVLAGGEGTRLRPFTFSMPKHLVPLVGKAMIEYPITHLVMSGIDDITIVIGYLGHMIQEYLGDGSRYGARFRYVIQEKRLGIAHAINLALESGKISGPFVVYLGDNILAKGISDYVKKFEESDYDAYVLLTKVSNPHRFGVAIIRDGKINGFIEKPKQPISDNAVIGVYFFRDPDTVTRAYKTLSPSWRGEYEITELLQWYINNNKEIGYTFVSGWWKDVGTFDSLLEALHLILGDSTQYIRGDVSGDITGKVIVEEGAVVEGSIEGPAYIGKGVYIGKKASIKSFVSIEERAKIISGTVRESLILNDALIDLSSSELVKSIIGRKARIAIKDVSGVKVKLLVSDYSVVEL